MILVQVSRAEVGRPAIRVVVLGAPRVGELGGGKSSRSFDRKPKNHRNWRVPNKTIMIWYIFRWWFQIFFTFIPIWGRFPIWLFFFKWLETTNFSPKTWDYSGQNYSDLTGPKGPQMVGSVGEMGPLISGKSRSVKYYFIWPEIITTFFGAEVSTSTSNRCDWYIYEEHI